MGGGTGFPLFFGRERDPGREVKEKKKTLINEKWKIIIFVFTNKHQQVVHSSQMVKATAVGDQSTPTHIYFPFCDCHFWSSPPS